MINIYQFYNSDDEQHQNSELLFIPVTSLALVTIWYLSFLGYQLYNFSRLQEEKMKDRMGVLYEDYSLKRASRGFILINFWFYVRKVSICIIMTKMRGWLILQCAALNATTIVHTSMVSNLAPFEIQS